MPRILPEKADATFEMIDVFSMPMTRMNEVWRCGAFFQNITAVGPAHFSSFQPLYGTKKQAVPTPGLLMEIDGHSM